MEATRYFSYLSVGADKKYEISICINYAKESSRLILPRIGMAEYNGDNFQDIKMDIGFDFDAIDLLVLSSTQEDNLPSILSKCINVKNISVTCTLLRSFDISLQLQNIPFVRRLELDRSLVYGSFLLDMSFHLPFIDEFVVNQCRFDGESKKNITIDISDTTFTKIVYNVDYDFLVKVYLKLTTLENNTTSCFVAKDHLFNTCTENEYQNSLQNTRILSLFIKCKQIDSFSLRASSHSLTKRIKYFLFNQCVRQ
ncbi:hypothetical protein HPULCUR_010352 [Helicostylum pulchrum]|uniref:Uncharacterized protein n=1 Tax=Helicostylum pulchrum TaxID=562976 RepID=A0ABP9YD01_9FUNG